MWKKELKWVSFMPVLITFQVALLQETVWRECQEREELTAALSQARQELFGRQSIVSPRGASGPPPNPLERRASPRNKRFYPQGKARGPLNRSPVSPASLQPSPTCTDKDRGLHTGVRGVEESLDSRRIGGALGKAKKQEATLPPLKASSTASEVKFKVQLTMGRK